MSGWNAQLIALDQRESRAWHFQIIVIAQGPQQCSCKGRLSRSEITMQGKAVPRLQGKRQIFPELDRRRLIGKRKMKRYL
ncbi:hypothetical protein RvVAR0630_03220 [Agrobacterium vitis]|nr:hypothetical protein RvVAR0630_03220 [Agrobacterium vitis]